MIKVVFTCGDINGIGPEIAVKAFSNIFKKRNNNQIIFICPKNVFKFYYKSTKASFNYQIIDRQSFSNSLLNLIPLPDAKFNFGKPTASSGRIAFNSINQSLELIHSDRADILVTTPISKKAFNLAKINFPGHTELLAKSENNKNYMMLFLSDKIRAGLLTIHSPISKVSDLIVKERIIKSINLLNVTAMRDLTIANPKIAVLGLNPHAGEDGLIGNEEEKIIKPAIKSLQKKNKCYGTICARCFLGK